MRRRIIITLRLTALLAGLAGCASTPFAGRSQLMLVSESRERALGEEAYRHIVRQSVLSRNAEAERIVRKVGERIARAANKPDYQWEFRVIDDPEMINAFAVPGGKVAVYTGILPVARDETGLAVILGHEVAHVLARHAGERMSQDMLVQLGGLGLAAGLGGNPQLANQVLQAYGLGASVGLILPYGRSQESEADRIGLILMAKAGYDPRVALGVWERMEKSASTKERSAPPEFLSTHPGYETRTQQLRSYIPEAVAFYSPTGGTLDSLPSAQELDSALTRTERELVKKIQLVNKRAADPEGERAAVEAMGHVFRVDPALLHRERQQLGIGYGEYVALRGAARLGRAALRQVWDDYRRGVDWTSLAERHGTRVSDLIAFMDQFSDTAAAFRAALRRQPLLPGLPRQR